MSEGVSELPVKTRVHSSLKDVQLGDLKELQGNVQQIERHTKIFILLLKWVIPLRSPQYSRRGLLWCLSSKNKNKKKATTCTLKGTRTILKETVSLIFVYLKRLLKFPQKNIFRVHSYVNKDVYHFSDPRSDSRTLTKRTCLPIFQLQLTVIAFVVSEFLFVIGAFLWDRRLVKVPVYLKALSRQERVWCSSSWESISYQRMVTHNKETIFTFLIYISYALYLLKNSTNNFAEFYLSSYFIAFYLSQISKSISMSLLRKPERRGATLKSILIVTTHWIRATVTISSPTDRVTKLIISYNVQSVMITTKLERTTDRVTKLIISYSRQSIMITTDRIRANNGQNN